MGTDPREGTFYVTALLSEMRARSLELCLVLIRAANVKLKE